VTEGEAVAEIHLRLLAPATEPRHFAVELVTERMGFETGGGVEHMRSARQALPGESPDQLVALEGVERLVDFAEILARVEGDQRGITIADGKTRLCAKRSLFKDFALGRIERFERVEPAFTEEFAALAADRDNRAGAGAGPAARRFPGADANGEDSVVELVDRPPSPDRDRKRGVATARHQAEGAFLIRTDPDPHEPAFRVAPGTLYRRLRAVRLGETPLSGRKRQVDHLRAVPDSARLVKGEGAAIRRKFQHEIRHKIPRFLIVCIHYNTAEWKLQEIKTQLFYFSE